MTSFSLDGYRCSSLEVGSFDMDATTLFAGAPTDELDEALDRHGFDSGRIVFQVRALLVDTGANRVLIDPAGTWDDPQRLEAVLEQAAIDPTSIDSVVVSHGHADHYWGGIRSDGGPLFTNASYFIQRQEWQHWLSGDNPEPDHAQTFRETLLPIESSFRFLDGESEIVPGIRALPTPGHSPGHMAVGVGERALYTGDALLSPLNVERPGWAASFDVWQEQVLTSRIELLRRVAGDGSLVLTCHFPDSGAGRVVAAGDGWRWQPEELA
jgi:glyoxylase-like metal-dependent hydrolase (beta-lactamase superfamily II)